MNANGFKWSQFILGMLGAAAVMLVVLAVCVFVSRL